MALLLVADAQYGAVNNQRGERTVRTYLLAAVLLVPQFAFGTLLVNEPFTYADGNIVGATGSPWAVLSSGGNGPVTVVSNQLKVVLGNNEDVSLALSGSPYNTGNGVTNLYASMTVNFTALPSATGGGSSGNFFASFRDSTSFRCRLFAAQTNAASGSYRLAIGSTNAAFTSAGVNQFPLDLSLNTAYTAVVRLNLNTGNSTLWINPTTEASASVSSTADPGTTAAIAEFAFRQTGSTPGTVLVDNLKIGTVFADVAGPNTAPVIGALGDQSTPAGTAIGPISIDVSDAETPAANLIVTASSSNPSLVSNGGLALTGTGGTRYLTITPLPGQQGATTITLRVTDTDNNTVSNSFQLRVGAPSISAVANQNLAQGSVLPPISFTILDHENDPLTLTASSSNTNLLPNTVNNITLAGTGTNRTVTLTPSAGQSGVTTITLAVTDGINTNDSTFTLAVHPQYGLLFSESFSYPDGPLLSASNSPWLHHSPTGTNNLNELLVAGGTAALNQNLSEDLNATLTHAPFAPSNAAVLYASLTLRATSLPAKTGDYFVHLKDSGTTFRGKIFVQTTNAAAGSYRLSAANADSSPAVEIARDLSLNVNYTVVFRYDCVTATTTLWINPVLESDASVTAADITTPATISAVALREGSGIGVLQVDDLKLGTSFTDVTTTRPTLQFIPLSGRTLQILWPASAGNFILQSSTNLTNWQTAGTPILTNGQYLFATPAIGTNLFFRLKQ